MLSFFVWVRKQIISMWINGTLSPPFSRAYLYLATHTQEDRYFGAESFYSFGAILPYHGHFEMPRVCGASRPEDVLDVLSKR